MTEKKHRLPVFDPPSKPGMPVVEIRELFQSDG